MLMIIEGSPHSQMIASTADQISACLRAHAPRATVTLLHGTNERHTHTLPFYEKFSPYHREIMSESDMVIAHNWHLKEALASVCTDLHPAFSASQLTHCEMYLSTLGAARLMVFTSLPHRRDDGSPEEEMQDAMARYVLNDPYHWRLLHGPLSVAQIRDLVIKAMVTTHTAQRLVPFPSYVGSPTPRTLLVTTNHPTDPSPPYPPLRPGPHPPIEAPLANTGHYLFTALSLAFRAHPGFSAAHVGVLVTTPDHMRGDGDTVTHAWEELQRPHIIALGGVADHLLTLAHLPHDLAPHPHDLAQAPQDMRKYSEHLFHTAMTVTTPLFL